jgi:large conductance mechanosensitive channel
MEERIMLTEFKKFLLQTNALALAVGVIIGAAVGKVVSSLVADILMPLIGLLIPGGAWREQKWVLTVKPDGTPANSITYGAFLGNVIDFVIIAFVVFMITKALLKPAPAEPGPPSKECPECKEIIPAAARKCRACASPV